MEWTKEREGKLRALWEEGLSARMIATRLGEVTRNAVIGKVHRLGLSGRRAPSGGVKAGLLEKKVVSLEKRRGEKAPAFRAPQPSRSVDLTAGMCRWPEGDPGEDGFYFCGREKMEGRPYCREHARKAYRTRVGE